MIKACLLVCDHVQENFAHQHGSYPDMFRRLFPKLQLDPFFVCDGVFPDARDFDVFICTGSKFSVYDPEEWIYGLSSLIVDVEAFGRKFIGICFGHQMIGHALGGKVAPARTGWNIGVHDFRVISEKDWMVPFAESISVPMLCQDQVVQLPPYAEVIAESIYCPFGVIQVGRNILGIQGHPEFTKSYNKAVYESRSEKIGSDKIEEANSSMYKDLSNRLFESWTMKFLDL